MNQNQGVTLIELIITVAIIGILAAIAFPSYEKYVQRTHRSEVIANMSEMAQWLERQYSKNNQYPTAAQSAAQVSAAGTDRYNVAIAFTQTNGRNTDYSITATATGPQTSDSADGQSCATLTLTAIGNQTPAACWK